MNLDLNIFNVYLYIYIYLSIFIYIYIDQHTGEFIVNLSLSATTKFGQPVKPQECGYQGTPPWWNASVNMCRRGRFFVASFFLALVVGVGGNGSFLCCRWRNVLLFLCPSFSIPALRRYRLAINHQTDGILTRE